jgi:polysaccharide biosynthesis/export protein
LLHHRPLLTLILICGLGSSACGPSGSYTWFSQLPSGEWAPPAGDYILGAGDAIDVRVYDQENLSLQAKIREDGKLSMPFVGEIVAAGKPPAALARELEQHLKAFIVAPRVTLNVVDSVPISVSVMGEVATRGTVTARPPLTLLQALAQSGGLSDYADDEAIFVIRRTPSFRRIRFRYDDLVQNVGGAATFALRTGDVVVVE